MAKLQNFADVVGRIRSIKGADRVPDFDPSNGNEAAKFLLLLEAPGPKALQSRKIVSLDNDDPSAKNLREQLDRAGVSRLDLAIWNVVPWYLGNDDRTSIRSANRRDVEEAAEFLMLVVDCMPQLRCIVLVGTAARRAHIQLSMAAKAHILACHHTSARVTNVNRAAFEQNVQVFKQMKAIGSGRGETA